MIVSETLPVFLMLVRRHTNMSSLSMLDWILAFAGTAAPLLVSPATLSPIVPFAFCLVLAVLGIELQVAAKLTLARVSASWPPIAAASGIEAPIVSF